jgi:glycosyltransferase involved in cell wall biosynthesis
MSCGVPVIITNTIGFWDSDKFKDNYHLIKLEDNELNNWVSKINEIFKNEELLNEISENGVELINKNYDINKFNEYIEKTMIID